MKNYLQDIYFDNLTVTYNLGGFLSIMDKDWAYPLHKFEQCKFYFITEGECYITIENTTFHGTKGDFFFIPSGAEHSYYNVKNKPFEKYWAHFDLYPDSNIPSALNLPFVIKSQNFSTTKKTFKKLTDCAKSNDFADKLSVKACLLTLLSSFVKTAKPDGVTISRVRDDRIDNLLRYINENLERQLDNDCLAKKYFAHPNHFIRAFRDKTGTTPAKYIRQKRMERAKLLLETTDLSTAEIAEKLCLTDGAHLCRLYKETFNTTPTKYRDYYAHKTRLIKKN